MKPFYRKKGKYADGRDRIVIVDRDNNKSKALPKPEALMRILSVPKVYSKQVSNFKGDYWFEVSNPQNQPSKQVNGGKNE